METVRDRRFDFALRLETHDAVCQSHDDHGIIQYKISLSYHNECSGKMGFPVPSKSPTHFTSIRLPLHTLPHRVSEIHDAALYRRHRDVSRSPANLIVAKSYSRARATTNDTYIGEEVSNISGLYSLYILKVAIIEDVVGAMDYYASNIKLAVMRLSILPA
jgi:hypothetical protein